MTNTKRQLEKSFSVGDWLIDGESLCARRGATTEALEPRAYQVLRYLAEHQGRLVTIDELMDALWKGTVVTPNAVTRIIAQLRKALDDDARRPTYIETVARTGYRLIADVDSGMQTRSGFALLIAAILLIAIVLPAASWFLQDEQNDPSIAVYPFENFTGDESLSYIGDGVAEEIINSLVKVPELLVASRSTSFRYGESERDPMVFARSVGVNYFVEGSVRRSGQQLRFTAQLIDVGTGNHLWSHTSEHDMQGLFEGQDSISRELTLALASELNIDVEPERLAVVRPPLPEAYDLYLRGRQIWHRRGSEPLEPAVDYFSEAVKIDPDFARGWAALASAYVSWPSYSPKGYGTWRDAEQIAAKALELDPKLAEPYGVLGTFAAVRREWREAHRLFGDGVLRNERNPTAHFWLAEHLINIGHVNDGLRHLLIALRLDPAYKTPQADIGWAHLTFGNPAVGAARFEALWHSGMQSMEPWVGLYVAKIISGQHADALEWLERAPLDETGKKMHRRFLRLLAGESDDPEFIDEITTSNRARLDHRTIIQMTSFLGRYDKSFELVRARLERGGWVDTAVLWGPGTDIRLQPDFSNIMVEIGLVDFWDEFGWGDVCRREAGNIVCDARDVDLTILEDAP